MKPLRQAVPLLVLVLVTLLLGGCALVRRRAANRPPYKKLSAPIAYEMMRDNPEMLVIDLRSPQEYNGETGHVRRARNIPVERLPYRLLEISAFRDDTVLLYCRQDDCGEKGIAVLLASGFENPVLMDGGIDEWIHEGFKTVLPTPMAGGGPKPAGDGRGAVMPVRPGKPQKETTMEPPPPAPEPPPPPPPGPRVAGPR